MAVDVGGTCDAKDNVSPGPFGYYTAVCVDGIATLAVYVQDKIFGSDNRVGDIPSRCYPLNSGDNTVE
jgi:hypothetical protein